MTIDEAIAHAREVANTQRGKSGICLQNGLECEHFSDCLKCAEEHEQLAAWLEELKAYREIGTVEECKNSVLDIQKAYNKAIDECNKKLDELERNYKSCFGTKIIEMYADVYEDFRTWLRSKND